MKINEIKVGEPVQVFAKIAAKNTGNTRDGSLFLSLTLMDDTGSINAKVWDASEEHAEFFKNGEVYLFQAEAITYNDKTQLKLEPTFCRVATKEDNLDLNVFYTTAPMSQDEIATGIKEYIKKIENPVLYKIVVELLKKYWDDFKLYPAATQNHHAFISGLSFHVLTMLQLSDKIMQVYDYVDKDFVYAGIILHDLGKVIELSDHKGPEYTTIGKLVGHINIMTSEVRTMAISLGFGDKEDVFLLEHIILSHHGRREWGSPVKPMTAEAELVHYCDLIDSKLSVLKTELEETNEGDFTKRISVLDGRSFYKKNG